MEEKKYRILVVDDEEDIRVGISNILERRMFEVTAVGSAEEAVETVRSGKFDLVLLDVVLPGMNGIEGLEQIRKIDPETEVLMISGNATIEMAIDCMKKGASDFIEKPVLPHRLLTIIEKTLDRHVLAEQVALYEISRAIFSTIEFKDLLRIIVELTMRVLNADDMALMLLNEKKQLQIAVSNGLDERVQRETNLEVGERIAGWVAENRQPLILINGLKGDERFSGIRGREAIRSAMVVPLLKNSELLGILTVNRLKIVENFNKSDLYRANIFASLVALALDNARLFEQLRASHEALVISQDQLIQSTKLAAIGQLVSEMAHEVNNPLMVISGLAQMQTLDDDVPEKVKAEAKVIFEECRRAHSIMQRLLKFSRPSKGEFKEMDLHSAIEYLLSIIQHQFETRGIRIVKRFNASSPTIKGDEQQLQEVLLNLMNNAKDAIVGQGTIEIMTSTWERTVRVEIKDSGEGIKPEVMEKLFSPYFTTKSNGNGLGLSICRTIMRKHGGDLRLESVPGKGTSAIIDIPLLGDLN